MRGKFWIPAIALVVILIVGSMPLWAAPAAVPAAGPLAIPTPLAPTGFPATSSRLAKTATLWSGKALTASGASSAVDIAGFGLGDVQVVIDVGTVNTSTVKLQFSNDNSNWVDGVAVASAITADTNTLAQYVLFGRYVRAYATLTNSNPITMTVIGLAK